MRARVLERVRSPLAAADLHPVGDQVRVRLTASGVCHSDLHALDGDWTVPLPLVLGHEGAGVVEAIGRADTLETLPGLLARGGQAVIVGLRTVLVA